MKNYHFKMTLGECKFICEFESISIIKLDSQNKLVFLFNKFQIWARGSEQGRGYPLMEGRGGGTREEKREELLQMASFSNCLNV